MIFDCREVQVAGKGGEIDAVGVEWTEARKVVEGVLDWFAKGFFMIGLLAVAIAVVAGLVAGERGFVPAAALAAVMLGIGLGTIRTSANMAGKRRRVLFHADGSISSSEDGRWTTGWADIRNIESVQLHQRKSDEELPYTHGVRMISRRGRVLHFARNLAPDDAASLAVVLSEVLESVKHPQVMTSIGDGPVTVW